MKLTEGNCKASLFLPYNSVEDYTMKYLVQSLEAAGIDIDEICDVNMGGAYIVIEAKTSERLAKDVKKAIAVAKNFNGNKTPNRCHRNTNIVGHLIGEEVRESESVDSYYKNPL